MYKKILLAYDGSEAGQRALVDCEEIGQWSGSELFLIAVMPPPISPIGGETWEYSPQNDVAERSHYKATLDAGLKRLRDDGLKADDEVMVSSSMDEIVRVARQIKADLIVVGHKHLDSWAQRWWRGSVSKSLIEYAPCSVLVVITN